MDRESKMASHPQAYQDPRKMGCTQPLPRKGSYTVIRIGRLLHGFVEKQPEKEVSLTMPQNGWPPLIQTSDQPGPTNPNSTALGFAAAASRGAMRMPCSLHRGCVKIEKEAVASLRFLRRVPLKHTHTHTHTHTRTRQGGKDRSARYEIKPSGFFRVGSFE